MSRQIVGYHPKVLGNLLISENMPPLLIVATSGVLTEQRNTILWPRRLIVDTMINPIEVDSNVLS